MIMICMIILIIMIFGMYDSIYIYMTLMVYDSFVMFDFSDILYL